jgi:hypothetical protein
MRILHAFGVQNTHKKILAPAHGRLWGGLGVVPFRDSRLMVPLRDHLPGALFCAWQV